MCRLGALLLLGVEGGVCRVSWILFLLMSLKHNSRYWDKKREKGGVSCLGFSGLPKRGTFWVGQPGFSFSCIVGDMLF